MARHKTRRGTRAGQKRTTRRAPGAALTRAFGRAGPKRRPGVSQKRFAGLTAAKAAQGRRLRALRSELGNPSAAKALGMGVYGGAATIAGGGAIAGVTTELFPSVMGVDTRLIAGALLVTWGGMSKKDPAQIAACLGAGMLACYAEDLASGMVSGEGFTFFEQTTTTTTAGG